MHTPANRPDHWKRYVLILAVVWTIIIAVSFAWNRYELKQEVEESARIQANMAYDKNIVYRRWNTDHGGVYVEVTGDVQPNPYLAGMPERDVITPSGRTLTLMNPAFMMRQIYEITQVEYGISERLIGIDPLNPANLPDSWEAEAIKSFERGTRIISAIDYTDGAGSMRLIRPLITEKRCLGCHASQGYLEGDIHGALSIIVPLAPLWKAQRHYGLTLLAAHVIIWLIGIIGIALVSIRLKHNEEEIQNALYDKETLLYENEKLLTGIHQRITNNLQTIEALLQIQSHAVERGDNVQVKDVLVDFRDRIRSMTEIHELLHHSGEFSSVDFRKCMEVVGGNLIRNHNMEDRVEFKVEGNLTIGIIRATPCSLILNELISNSLRYAFPNDRKGNIKVTLLEETPGDVEIKVSDDGVGIDESIDWRNPVSVGLDLVNGLVIQIQGTLELDRSHGTEFSIKFKRDD